MTVSSTGSGKENKFGHFVVVVVQLIHRLTQADISCTTTARLFSFPLLDHQLSSPPSPTPFPPLPLDLVAPLPVEQRPDVRLGVHHAGEPEPVAAGPVCRLVRPAFLAFFTGLWLLRPTMQRRLVEGEEVFIAGGAAEFGEGGEEAVCGLLPVPHGKLLSRFLQGLLMISTRGESPNRPATNYSCGGEGGGFVKGRVTFLHRCKTTFLECKLGILP